MARDSPRRRAHEGGDASVSSDDGVSERVDPSVAIGERHRAVRQLLLEHSLGELVKRPELASRR